MVSPKHVTATSRVLAALVFVPFVASTLTGVFPSVFADFLLLQVLASPLPGSMGALYFVVLGWLLGIVLAGRAFLTENAADAVLAAFSLPCLIGAPVVLYHTYLTAPSANGTVVVPVLTAAAAVLLAGFVLLDGAMDLRRSVRKRRRSKTSA